MCKGKHGTVLNVSKFRLESLSSLFKTKRATLLASTRGAICRLNPSDCDQEGGPCMCFLVHQIHLWLIV